VELGVLFVGDVVPALFQDTVGWRGAKPDGLILRNKGCATGEVRAGNLADKRRHPLNQVSFPTAVGVALEPSRILTTGGAGSATVINIFVRQCTSITVIYFFYQYFSYVKYAAYQKFVDRCHF
jgi:hypothetical protein